MPSIHEAEGIMPSGDSYFRYIEAGHGQALIFLHSYLWDAEMWRPQIEAFAGHYHVVVPELWGHGGSGPLPSDVGDIKAMARHHLNFMDQLEISEATIVGLSVGGMIAVEMAAIAPRRVSGLALLDTYVGPEPGLLQDEYFTLLAAIDRAGSVPDAILDKVEALFFSPATRAANPQLPKRFRAEIRQMNATRLRQTIVPAGRIIFGRPDRRPALSEISVPALVITGADDVARPPREGREMAELLQCPFVEIPGAGHIPSLEAPEAVTDALLTLFRRVDCRLEQYAARA